MPIFQIQNKKVLQIALDQKRFPDEAALRDFFAENLVDLLGIRFLAKEYQTKDGRIDTLAIDETGAPVIIEYKWNEKDNILPQGLFYFDWLRENRRHFDLLVEKKLGHKVKVNWDKPRVVLVAQGFDRYTLAAVKQIKYVELIKYTPYQNGIVLLETMYSPETSKPIAEKKTKDEESYSVHYHLGDSNEEVKKIFYYLQERTRSLPGVKEMAEQKVGITYRTTKSFVRFEFGKSYIDVLLREPKYDDLKGMVKDITSFEWGYKGRAKIKSLQDAEYVLGLIKQSYESTL
ncbi:MAG: hypothetical protein JW902_11580 [Syntrophaceae bacterium]|nr:hypothetical protein [Syntrophaceae bacterium]